MEPIVHAACAFCALALSGATALASTRAPVSTSIDPSPKPVYRLDERIHAYVPRLAPPSAAAETTTAMPSAVCDWTFGSNVRVHPSEGGQHLWPDIAVAPNGVVGAAWMDDHAAGGYHIFYSASSDGGISWSAPEKVDTRSSGQYSKFVDLEFTPSSIPVLVWEDDRLGSAAYHVYFSKRDPAGGGTPWTPNVPLNTIGSPPDGTSFMNPSLAVLDDARCFVAWTDWREGVFYQVYCRRSYDGGATWSAETRISDELGFDPVAGDPCLVVDPASPSTPGSERLYCVTNDWRGDVPGGRFPNVYFYRSVDGGASWSAGVRVNDIEPQFQQASSHALVVRSDGSLTSGWLNNTTGVSHFRSCRSIDQGAHWSSSVQVDPPSAGGSGTYSSIAGFGSVVFAGFDLYESDWNAYHRVSVDGGLTWSALACRMDDDASGAASGNTVLAAASAAVVYGAWSDSRPGLGAWKIYTARGEQGSVSVPDGAAGAIDALTCAPNPCPLGSSMRIELSSGAAARGRLLAIYDITGRRVTSLRASWSARGPHALRWDGRRSDGRALVRGAYWVRLEGEGGAPIATAPVRIR